MSFSSVTVFGTPVTTAHTTNQRDSYHYLVADKFGRIWTVTIATATNAVHVFYSDPPYSSWTEDASSPIYTPTTPTSAFSWSILTGIVSGRPIIGVRTIENALAFWRLFLRDGIAPADGWTQKASLLNGTNGFSFEKARIFVDPTSDARWFFIGAIVGGGTTKCQWRQSADTGATFTAAADMWTPVGPNGNFLTDGMYDFVQGTGSVPTLYGMASYSPSSSTILKLREVTITDPWGTPAINIADADATNFAAADEPFKVSIGLDRVTGDLHCAFLRLVAGNRRMNYKTKPFGGAWSAFEVVSTDDHESCGIQVDTNGTVQIVTSKANVGTHNEVNLGRYVGGSGAWTYEEILDEASDHRNIGVLKHPQFPFGTPKNGLFAVLLDDTNDDFEAIVESTFSLDTTKSGTGSVGL